MASARLKKVEKEEIYNNILNMTCANMFASKMMQDAKEIEKKIAANVLKEQYKFFTKAELKVIKKFGGEIRENIRLEYRLGPDRGQTSKDPEAKRLQACNFAYNSTNATIVATPDIAMLFVRNFDPKLIKRIGGYPENTGSISDLVLKQNKINGLLDEYVAIFTTAACETSEIVLAYKHVLDKITTVKRLFENEHLADFIPESLETLRDRELVESEALRKIKLSENKKAYI